MEIIVCTVMEVIVGTVMEVIVGIVMEVIVYSHGGYSGQYTAVFFGAD